MVDTPSTCPDTTTAPGVTVLGEPRAISSRWSSRSAVDATLGGDDTLLQFGVHTPHRVSLDDE